MGFVVSSCIGKVQWNRIKEAVYKQVFWYLLEHLQYASSILCKTPKVVAMSTTLPNVRDQNRFLVGLEDDCEYN